LKNAEIENSRNRDLYVPKKEDEKPREPELVQKENPRPYFS